MLYSSSKIVPYEAESAQNKRFQSQATVEYLYTILIVTDLNELEYGYCFVYTYKQFNMRSGLI